MSALILTIDISGADQSAAALQALRNALAARKPMHTRMAEDAVTLTQDYLKATPNHGTANRLGATPTGRRATIAKSIEPAADATAAFVLIPRRTGLGRAFHDVVLLPGSGRTYLTIPASAATYGHTVRDFPQDAFRFAILRSHRLFPVLLWAADGAGHRKGDVAFWLRRQVTQKQDRRLLPSDAGYSERARKSAADYIATLIQRSAAPSV